MARRFASEVLKHSLQRFFVALEVKRDVSEADHESGEGTKAA